MMMTDMAYAPVCGIYCGECPFFGKQCPGCGNVDGKPFWTSQMPDGICPLHACCRHQKELEHCGHCAAFPCKTFNELRDPSMTDEEFQRSLNSRKSNLTTRIEIGTEKWLEQKTSQQRSALDSE
jgi:hypothetical protein